MTETDSFGVMHTAAMTDFELRHEIQKHALALDEMTADNPNRPAMHNHLDQYTEALAARKRERAQALEAAILPELPLLVMPCPPFWTAVAPPQGGDDMPWWADTWT